MALPQQANPEQSYMPLHSRNQTSSVETPALYQQRVPPSFYGGSRAWLDAGIAQPQAQLGGSEFHFSSNPFDGSYENDGEDDDDPPAGDEEDDGEQDPNATLRGPVTLDPPQQYLPNPLQVASDSQLPPLPLHNQSTAHEPLQMAHQQLPQTFLPQQRISQFSLAAAAVETAAGLPRSEVDRRLTSQIHMVRKSHVI
jgi:hypothetical protein